ncbi:MAG TPA: EAL domain-containing protein [Gaiellaceae bacterium]|jgi:EAL domain-containing protein (putative c-di-GMP-specific phosphodiesterase class I)|nr:EAL domain-containing protein [Gaiellaceae bacterium]
MSQVEVLSSRSERELDGERLEEAGEDARLVELANRVIDERKVQTLFQPLVHLPTSEVVGFEALARGPEGTPLESPLALLSAARSAGRLQELDWLCAASACAAAQAARLHPSMSVFLNFEPVTLLTPCPEDLLQLTRRAQDQLRVFVETKEQSLLDDPGRVFTGLAQVREIGWGVAIDNAVASPASLGLFPLIRPDVIKLDLQATRGDAEAVGLTSDGARLYAEQTGASILAQGLEAPDDLRLARAAGAGFGQGWYFGRPAPLTATTAIPRDVVPLRQQPAPDLTATPFRVVANRLSTPVTERRFLEPIAAYLAEQTYRNGPPALLLVSFELRHVLGETELARLRELVTQSAFTVLVGPETGIRQTPRSLIRHVRRDEPLGAEWNVIVLGPHYAGALVAHDLGDEVPEHDRRFEYAITHDRDLVLAAAQVFLGAAATRGSTRTSDDGPEEGVGALS